MGESIQEKAQELYDALEVRKRPDGKKYYCLKNDSPLWMSDLIRQVHGDRLPDDYVYETIAETAAILADADPDADVDELWEALAEGVEADLYTKELTDWLGDSIYNITYLNQVLEDDLGIKDGFQLLAYAQYLFKQEIARAVLDELVKLVKESD